MASADRDWIYLTYEELKRVEVEVRRRKIKWIYLNYEELKPGRRNASVKWEALDLSYL